MDLFLNLFLAFLAVVWVVQGIRAGRGALALPRLSQTPPLADSECPTVSILFSARDEAEKLPQALPTLLAQDYPGYEVVAVNDRSRDATPQILEEAARTHSNLKVVHVEELPKGWLGKPHALQRAAEQARGEWLVFTDADVRFAPDLLRRAMALAKARGWDHLTLLGWVDMVGFWEKVLMTYFMLGFTLYSESWRVSDPRSGRYAGVGSFQLLRRSAYETIGGYHRLAMEVVDDMKLGKLVKQGGFRSGVGNAGPAVKVRWQAGLGNIIRGTTKNFFASAGFSVARIAGQMVALVMISVVPFVALFATSGPARVFAAVAAGVAAIMQAGCARETRVSVLYGLTHPVGALIFGYMLLRSTVVTLWRGGVEWRGTFYPLEELRKGIV